MPDYAQTTVIKRDGSKQPFNPQKVIDAMTKACLETGEKIDPQRAMSVLEGYLEMDINPEVSIETLQDIAEHILMDLDLFASAKAFILYRQRQAEIRGLKAPEEAVTDYIVASKYARWQPHLKRREVFSEIVDRVQDMHIRKYPTLEKAIKRHFQLVRDKRVMPSMRSMQFGGKAIETHNARMYNCSFTLVDRTRVFGEAFYLLLCGCGVGFSIQKQHVSKLPPIQHPDLKTVAHFTVEDCIEGWADSITALIDSYTLGYYVEFNYSNIRPVGSLLETSGGLAPGHLPLKSAHHKIKAVLDKAVGRKLYPIECHDIMCFIAEAVLAGGIRRSSLISLFSADDEDMMLAKTSEHFSFGGKNAQREMANNSAVFLRSELDDVDCTGKDKFRACFDFAVSQYGEPGFFLTDNLDYGTNPCGEIGLNPVYCTEPQDAEDEISLVAQGFSHGISPQGNACLRITGWSFCNLCEINMACNLTPEQCIEAAESAAFIGTLQASYTKFPYLGEATEVIAKRDALLGVGMTGMMDNPDMSFNPEVVRAMAEAAKQANLVVATEILIKTAARITTVKPSGTASLALGMIGSGIHPHHSKRYFRRITANPLEPVARFFQSKNPHMVQTKPNGDWCLTFPVQAPASAKTVKAMSATEFLDYVFDTYENWIKPGTVNPYHSPGLTHNVSSTVVVDQGEWGTVFNTVWHNRHRIQAMSFLPRTGDKGNPFMPREEVLAEDEGRWADLINQYVSVDYASMVEESDGTTLTMDPACLGGTCSLN